MSSQRPDSRERGEVRHERTPQLSNNVSRNRSQARSDPTQKHHHHYRDTNSKSQFHDRSKSNPRAHVRHPTPSQVKPLAESRPIQKNSWHSPPNHPLHESRPIQKNSWHSTPNQTYDHKKKILNEQEQLMNFYESGGKESGSGTTRDEQNVQQAEEEQQHSTNSLRKLKTSVPSSSRPTPGVQAISEYRNAIAANKSKYIHERVETSLENHGELGDSSQPGTAKAGPLSQHEDNHTKYPGLPETSKTTQLIQELLINFPTDPDSGAKAKIAVVKEGTVDIILKCLEHKKESRDFCPWGLCFLASVSHPIENKELLREKGTIEIILLIMSTQDDNAEILEWGSRCLHTLVSVANQDEIEDQSILISSIVSIFEAGGIEIIVNAMAKQEQADALLWSVKLIWRLLDGVDAMSCSGAMHRLNVIETLTKADFVSLASKILVKQDSRELFILSAELMAVIILAPYFEQDKLERKILFETASKCVPKILREMSGSTDDLETQAAGCALIAALSGIEGDMPAFLIRHGAIEVVTESLIELSDSIEVLEAGAWTLWKLSAVWRGSERSFNLNPRPMISALDVIARIAAKHSEHEIWSSLYGLALNLCGTEGLKSSDFPIDELTAGFRLVASQEGEEALVALCSTYPDCCMIVLKRLGVSSITDTLQSPISLHACSMLSTLKAVIRNDANTCSLLATPNFWGEAVSAMRLVKDQQTYTLLLEFLSSLAKIDRVELPRGFIEAVLSCLENFGSNEEFGTHILQSAASIIIRTKLNEDATLLLLFLRERIETSSFGLKLRIESCNLLWAIAAKRQVQDRTLIRDLINSLHSFMMTYNGRNVQPLNVSVLEAASGAWSGLALCTRDFPFSLELHQIDTLIGAVYCCIHKGGEAENVVLHVLSAVWHFCFTNETELLTRGMLTLLGDIIDKFIESAGVVEKCCALFSLLASAEDPGINLSIAEANGVEKLVMVMERFASDGTIQSEVSKAISHLTTEQDVRHLFAALGGIGPLLKAVETFADNIVLLERAFSVIMKITSDVGEGFLNIPQMARVIIKTIALHPESVDLEKRALRALQNLSMKGLEVKEIIAIEGGISTIIQMMQHEITTPILVECGFTTLWSLAVLTGNQPRIAEARGIDVVVSAMLAMVANSGSTAEERQILERVQLEGCGCLYTLALNSQNRLAIRESGGPEALVLSAVLHKNSEKFQAQVCKLMACLGTPCGVPIEISQEEAETTLSAMQKFPKTEDVQVHGCMALVNFIRASNGAVIVAVNAQAIVEAMNGAAASFPSQCIPSLDEFNLLISDL